MKRMRGNGGIRDILGPEGIAVLSGAYDAPLAKQLGYGILLKDEFLAISPSDQQQADLLQSMGHIS